MKKEELREKTINSIDGLMHDLEKAVLRGAAVFGMDEMMTDLIPSFLGIEVMPRVAGGYTGEMRDIGLLLNPKDRPWTQTIAQVSAISKQGNSKKTFKPGDYLIIPVSVTDNIIDGVEFPAIEDGSVKMVITEVFDTQVIFNFENVILHASVNRENTNEGGFSKSILAKYLSGHFMRSVFGAVEDYLTPNKDGLKVSIPTYFEVFGGEFDRNRNVNWGDVVRHTYFAKYTNRIKVNNDDVDDTNWWWLSTASNTADFCDADRLGYSNYHIASRTDGGVAPAICIS
ncbi:MAG: hypothetical protein LBH43_11155 [Treponema sp.]|jgi:hypothetical protein|nr:hypothetical protein [Treponema sp.]